MFQNVLEGLSRNSSPDRLLPALVLPFLEWVMEMDIKPFPAEVQRTSQKEFRVQSRRLNLMIFQIFGRPIEEF
jgi:hypothetical protein